MLIKKYLYIAPKNKCLILIRAKRKPSINTRPISGTWVVREWDGKQWQMPAFPEITWNTLKTFNYLGILKEEIK